MAASVQQASNPLEEGYFMSHSNPIITLASPSSVHPKDTNLPSDSTPSVSSTPSPSVNPAEITGEYFGYDEESHLKKILLKLGVQKELEEYFKNPSFLASSLFLRFLYDFYMEIPLLERNAGKGRAKFQQLLLALPRYVSTSQKAMKHSQENRKMRIFVVKIFDVMVRTPLERQRDGTGYRKENYMEILETYSKEEVDKEIEKENIRRTKIKLIAAEMSKNAQAIFRDIERPDGVAELCQRVREAKRPDELPKIYQNFVECMAQVFAIQMEKELSREEGISKWKRFDEKMPTRALKAILSSNNTTKLVNGLLNLFTARPFGAKSLLMKQGGVMVELKRTTLLLKDKKKIAQDQLKRFCFSKEIFRIFEDYVERDGFGNHIIESGTEDTNVNGRLFTDQILGRVLAESRFPADQLRQLTAADFSALREWLVVEVRLKEKSDFVNLLGSEEIVSMLRELLPVVYEPLITLFAKADAGSHFVRMFRLVKRMVLVGKKLQNEKVEDIELRAKMYKEILDQFTLDLWDFMRSAAKADFEGERVLEKCLEWYVHMLQFVHRRETLDVQSLLAAVDPATLEDITKELDGEVRYTKFVMKLDAVNRTNAKREKELEKEKAKHKHSIFHKDQPSTASSGSPSSSSTSSPTSTTSSADLEKETVERPTPTAISTLLPAFIELMRDRLSPKEVDISLPFFMTLRTAPVPATPANVSSSSKGVTQSAVGLPNV